MKWLALVGRVLVGGMFVFASAAYFGGSPPPEQKLPEAAAAFAAALGVGGYLTVVKVLELVGGVLVLSGKMAPMGLVLVTPVAVNIALFEVCLLKQPGVGVGLTAICFLLVWYYWPHFGVVLAPDKWV